MARPKLGDGTTERVHFVITDAEIQAIEDWRFKNRVQSKSEAIRRLCQIGLTYDHHGNALMKRTDRALKAMLMTIDRTNKALEKAPKGLRGALRVALEEQLAANKAVLSMMVAASVLADGADQSEFEDLIKRAEGYVEALVNQESAK